MRKTLVVVGASYAGIQLVSSAREFGFDGRIVLIGNEPAPPYHRPPLSKGFLTGSFTEDRLPLRSQAFFTSEQVEWMPSTRATSIDRKSKHVELQDGQRIVYDHLALTTGARVRKLDCRGAAHPAVHYLRDLSDARKLAQSARGSRRVVVVGGGYIGLEAASSLRQLGLEVTVIEMQDRLLARVASPWMSDFLLRAHAAQGVRFCLGRKIVAVRDTGNGASIELDDGTQHQCELALVGIGVMPNTELATESGLATSDGITVDSFAQTSDPSIVAAGDCAAFVPYWAPTRVPACRVESVQNANDMARTAAASIVGRPQPYRALPWFWSDQYNLKLQTAGVNTGFTNSFVRGCVEEHRFSVFYFRGEKLIAVDSINRPQDHMLARKLLANGATPTPQQVSDPSFDLKALAILPNPTAAGVGG